MIILKMLLTATLLCVAFLFGYQIAFLFEMLKYAFSKDAREGLSSRVVILLCLKIKTFRHALIKSILCLISIVLIIKVL